MDHKETTCNKCVNGKFFDTKEVGCKICPAGFRNSFAEAALGPELTQPCKVCPHGRYSADAAIDPAKHVSCQQCAKGFEYWTVDQECKACASGSYQNTPQDGNKAYCHTDCQMSTHFGSVCDKTCRRICQRCTKGKESLSPTTACTSCPKGKYQEIDIDSKTRKQECKVCNFGQYAASVGLDTCTQCVAGKFLFADNSPAHVDYHDDSSDCLSCIGGQHATEKGARQCIACPPGLSEQQGECTKCDAGKYMDENGVVGSCTNCTLGRYQNQTGQTTCLQCWSGTFQSESGQKLCNACPVGYYTDEIGKQHCRDCPVGFQQLHTRGGHCESCMPGKYGVKTLKQVSSCELCTKGKYQPEPDSKICLNCVSGMYGSKEGLTRCRSCISGMHGSTEGLTECRSCPVGWEKMADATAIECTQCKAGKTTFVAGSEACEDCPIGQKGSVDASEVGQCEECPAGLYQPLAGQESCLNCPMGFKSLVVGETGDKRRPGCVNPSYKIPNNCALTDEYLDDCIERGEGCLWSSVDNILTNTKLLQFRTCKQCEPGMICSADSQLSKRNILRKYGWYYLDSTVTIKMREEAEQSQTEREQDDHKYYDAPRSQHVVNEWIEAKGTADTVEDKAKYDVQNFSSVPCPVPSHCCGVQVPIVKDGELIVEEENAACAKMHYEILYGKEEFTYKDQIFERIKYPYWNNSCAAGVDTNYPLCAKCLTGYAVGGTAKECVECDQNAMVHRIIALSSCLVVCLVIFAMITYCGKCATKWKLHDFKSARGDVGRMMRLLIDFFQIVISMEHVMPSINWPSLFTDHLASLNFFDFGVMDIIGVKCSYNVDFINSMYIYFAMPLLCIVFALASLLIQHKFLIWQTAKLKNDGKLPIMWESAVGEMFEFLLEPNKNAKHDRNAPSHIVSEHGLQELLKISMQNSRTWSDPIKEAHKMIQRFSSHQGYLTKEEFCLAFTKVMDDRSKSSKSNFGVDVIEKQKFNLILWAHWQRLRSTILERTCLLLILVHAPICKVATRFFRCLQVGDRRYLMADYGVNCGTVLTPDGRYDAAWVSALLMVVVYTFGFPLALGYYVVKNRKVLFSFRVKMMVGWLYLHYEKHLYFWTLWEIFVKVFLMGFLFFIPEEQRPFMGTIVSTLALTLTSIFAPFKNNVVQSLAIMKWFSTALLYLSTTQLSANGGLQVGIMVALMILVDISFLVGVGLIFYRLSHALKSAQSGNATVRVRNAVNKMSMSFKLRNALNTPPSSPSKDVKVKSTSVSPVKSTANTSDGGKESTFYVKEPKKDETLVYAPAPREIGGGWWETYDLHTKRLFYSNVHGKETTWHWPAEVGRYGQEDDMEATVQLHSSLTNVAMTEVQAHHQHQKATGRAAKKLAKKRETVEHMM